MRTREKSFQCNAVQSLLSGILGNRIRRQKCFFQKVAQDATRFVERTNRGHEFLEGDKIQHFWHEHCAFCWEKALTDKSCEFYCTEDMKHWICAGCFRDLHEKFNWQVRPAEDLFR